MENQGMRPHYVIRCSETKIAIADLTELEGGFYINRINVPEQFRGQRIGARLLKMVLDDADKEGVTLFIDISPYGKMTHDDLRQWYERNGFKQRKLGDFKRGPRVGI